MGGDLVSGDAAREFAGVSIDTRTLGAGELFVAIRGERFDGADFAPRRSRPAPAASWSRETIAAASAGRRRPAAHRDAAGHRGGRDDVGAAGAGARSRRESGARVVAITGSAGKTTTKEVTAEFLGARFRVIRNRGNFNNHIGLPLSLIELRLRPKWPSLRWA